MANVISRREFIGNSAMIAAGIKSSPHFGFSGPFNETDNLTLD